MKDKSIQPEPVNEPRKRKVTAHDGLIFSNIHPTNADMDKHEREVEECLKKIPIRGTNYKEKINRVVINIVLFAVVIFFANGHKSLFFAIGNKFIVYGETAYSYFLEGKDKINLDGYREIDPKNFDTGENSLENNIFFIPNIKEFFGKYPFLEKIYNKSQEMNLDQIKEMISFSKKDVDKKLAMEIISAKSNLEELAVEMNLVSLSSEELSDWLITKEKENRELEVYLSRAESLLEHEKDKYQRWMAIRTDFDKDNVAGIRAKISESQEDAAGFKKEFSKTLNEYSKLEKADSSNLSKLKRVGLREKLSNQIGAMSSKSFLAIAMLADSVGNAEQEKHKLDSALKFLEKNDPQKIDKKKFLNNFEQEKVKQENNLQQIVKQVSEEELRSFIVFQKLNSK